MINELLHSKRNDSVQYNFQNITHLYQLIYRKYPFLQGIASLLLDTQYLKSQTSIFIQNNFLKNHILLYDQSIFFIS